MRGNCEVNTSDVDKLFDDLIEELKNTQGIKVGFMNDDKYPNGRSLTQNAITQEYGAIIDVPTRKGKVYHSINEKTGNFKRSGKFTKLSKSNLVRDVLIPAHKIIIPSRAFMEKAFNKASSWYDFFVSRLNGFRTLQDAVNDVGEEMKKDVQRAIMEIDTPVNASSTIRRKGSSKPLVNTGHMVGNVQKAEITKNDR